MSLIPLGIDAHPALFSDWLELRVLQSTEKSISVYTLRDMLRDSYEREEVVEIENLPDQIDFKTLPTKDIQEDDDCIEQAVSQTVEEVIKRVRGLEKAYPFTLSDDGATLCLNTDLNTGGYVYLYCLILSNAASGGIFERKVAPKLTNTIRDLFQICATIAAAGYMRGPAISFGWPRPDNSTVIDKLTSTHVHFPTATMQVRTAPLRGTPATIKDDGIDVLCWKHEALPHPALEYAMGQAASGANWEGKSVRTEIEDFCTKWISVRPVEIKALMFIPFCVMRQAENDTSHDDMTAMEIRSRSEELGKLIYRYYLPLHALEGSKLNTNIIHPIERLDEFPKVQEWVEEFLNTFAEAGT